MLGRPGNILAIILITIVSFSYADFSFDFDPGIRAGILPDGGFEVFLGGGYLTNTGSSEDIYHIVLDPSGLPDTWSANFCAFESCYPLEATSSLLAGRNTEVSVHVFPVDPGAGTVTLTISSDRTGEADTIIYWASHEPEVLIINDSGRPDVSLWYSNSFDNLDAIGGILNHIDIDFDSLDLSEFSSVLWFTGPDYDDVFDEIDTSVISDYLSGGGKFILSSQGAGSFCDGSGISSWLMTNLKAEWVEDDSAMTSFYGLPGTVFDGISGALGWAGGSESFDRPSVISATDGSVPLIQYDAVGSPTAAIGYYEETGSKLVYIGFPWEAISDEAVRDTVMAKALEYVNGAGTVRGFIETPANISIRAYPNPFNSAVTISLIGSDCSIGIIRIFDIMGKAVTVLALDDNNSVVWNGTNADGESVPAGVYFVKPDDTAVSAKRILFLE